MEKITDQIERLDELETLIVDFIELNRELVNENQALREKQKKLILVLILILMAKVSTKLTQE